MKLQSQITEAVKNTTCNNNLKAYSRIIMIHDIYISLYMCFKIQGSIEPYMDLEMKTHALLTSIEQLYDNELYNGPTEKLFAIIESCATKRPVSSKTIFNRKFRLKCVSISVSKIKGKETLLCMSCRCYVLVHIFGPWGIYAGDLCPRCRQL